MYAIFEQGGKQYKVSEGETVQIDLTDIDPQAKQMTFDKVLFVGDGASNKIGKPYVQGAKIVASFASTAEEAVVKGPKLFPTTFRRRKDSRRRIGHRQKSLRLTIDKIQA
jgi:large subunit ribosomal protein L21